MPVGDDALTKFVELLEWGCSTPLCEIRQGAAANRNDTAAMSGALGSALRFRSACWST